MIENFVQISKWPSCILVVAISVLSVGCYNDNPNSTETGIENDSKTNAQLVVSDLDLLEVTPLREKLGSDDTQFTEMTPEQTGVEFTNILNPENLRKYLLNGAGLCTGDYDNDGLVDMYLVCQDGPNKLYRQVSDWKFEDVTQSAGGLDGGDHWGRGATFADIENDGDLDLYLCNADANNQLFINQGDGTFVVDDGSHGANHPSATTMGTFADYDRDGDLDLYLVNNRLFTVGEESPDIDIIERDGKQMIAPNFRDQVYVIEGRIEEAGQHDVLLKNDGNGNFTDVTAVAGIAGYEMGLSATWWDYNNDGWLDIYVGNDFKMSDHLYRNNGDGTFTDVLPQVVPHTSWFSMGADAADLNSDGILDFMVADMSSTTHYKQKTTMGEMGRSAWFLTMGNPRQFMRNACYLSTGAGRFMEVANLTGLDSTDWTWSVKFGDYDNDAMIDVFVTNGYGKNDNDSDFQAQYKRLNAEGRKDEAAKLFMSRPPLEENNILFKNLGDLKFNNVADDWGVDHFGVSIGASSVDMDKDGDLDLIVSHLNDPISLYRNNSGDTNSLLVELCGSTSNLQGLGSKIMIETDAGAQVRQVVSARGYVSSDEAVTHFGLGEAKTIQALTVFWPSGIKSVYHNLPANHRIKVTEPKIAAKVRKPVAPTNSANLFVEVGDEVGLSGVHKEKPYDDYLREPLLPNKLSQLGPGMAWANLNGDDLMDCFVGGANGQPGSLYLQSPSGFNRMEKGPENYEAGHEDMGILFFDIDSDGDEDMYVVSGGVECEPGDEILQDRLYLNNGHAIFTKADDGQIPDIRQSGSTVTGCDFDRDGDIDLFVGSRVIPGRWPLAPRSTLLRNDDGKLVDVTDEIASELAEVGLVTGATWTHIDNDGWPDLVVALEWGPITVFKNDSGTLKNITDQLGLTKDTGWFNGVASADVDNDGDLDLIATNVGLNTKYHANHKHPCQLFVSDFDEDGRLDLVEAEWEGETCFPVRGRSCSSHAMPFIKDKFESYHDFGIADLNEIYTDTKIDASSQFAATRLESILIINNGDQPWTIKNLPRLAQASPGFGVVTSDFNADGFIDIFFVQNFMEPQPETGQMDGGLGCMLLGYGNGDFEFVYAGHSGIEVRHQGMAATLCDLNQDNWPDLTLTTNNHKMLAYQHTGIPNRKLLKLNLQGDPGNVRAVGSLVVVEYSDGSKRAFDISAGSGYLSQSTGEIFVAETQNAKPVNATVTWPDGSKSREALESKDGLVLIKKS